MNNPPEDKGLAAFVQTHGSRVRRREAMALLGIRDKHVFQKVVDANPDLAHKLTGEGQTKYLTAVVFRLLGEIRPAANSSRCATRGASVTLDPK